MQRPPHAIGLMWHVHGEMRLSRFTRNWLLRVTGRSFARVPLLAKIMFGHLNLHCSCSTNPVRRKRTSVLTQACVPQCEHRRVGSGFLGLGSSVLMIWQLDRACGLVFCCRLKPISIFRNVLQL
ncbi:uncharacterized protein LAESUDRAFT_143088 [Laetiporus sulphureus 93-53]|uniref:Uncharacterized protein n=1 Tax=Laetiporus sulphureus 93-53 TaxID=1314785 RepID=A0A165EF38_9APHY|nr:uncharacterized protein LAESUDRAFT_143088 [Laetiporus sulphureus 93-53]KZT06919.1 hypothetical protein LAESUDRAFT_143088 [Laetiporus sulphureus 93-53]